MRTRRNVTGDGGRSPLLRRFAAIRAQMDIPEDFPPEASEEAREAAHANGGDGRPVSDLPFFTLDPPGSRDLDQAMHLARDGSGYRVHYAIADVPTFVRPGGALDRAARDRGVTVYAPDRRTPLHPLVLSEGAASLLPGQDRPAFVWDVRLGGDGEIADVGLERRTVRSVARMDYPSVQREIDSGTPDEQLILLRDIGRLRADVELARGGASLALPDQEVVRQPGGWTVRFVPPLAVEDWNAQISLLTGIVAAQIMVEAGVGILRTMPPAEERAVRDLRSVAAGLGIDWPANLSYGQMLHRIDRTDPRHLAFILLHRPRRRVAVGSPRPRRARHAVRARHGPAAPPGRPFRPGRLRGGPRRPAGARVDHGRPSRRAEAHGGGRPPSGIRRTCLPGRRRGGGPQHAHRDAHPRRGHRRAR